MIRPGGSQTREPNYSHDREQAAAALSGADRHYRRQQAGRQKYLYQSAAQVQRGNQWYRYEGKKQCIKKNFIAPSQVGVPEDAQAVGLIFTDFAHCGPASGIK